MKTSPSQYPSKPSPPLLQRQGPESSISNNVSMWALSCFLPAVHFLDFVRFHIRICDRCFHISEELTSACSRSFPGQPENLIYEASRPKIADWRRGQLLLSISWGSQRSRFWYHLVWFISCRSRRKMNRGQVIWQCCLRKYKHGLWSKPAWSNTMNLLMPRSFLREKVIADFGSFANMIFLRRICRCHGPSPSRAHRKWNPMR